MSIEHTQIMNEPTRFTYDAMVSVHIKAEVKSDVFGVCFYDEHTKESLCKIRCILHVRLWSIHMEPKPFTHVDT